MKNINIILSLTVLLLGVSSCGFLDEDMSVKYKDSEIYGSEEALESAVLGCYEAFAKSGFMVDTCNEYFQPGSTLVHWGRTSGRLTDAAKRYVDCLSLTQFSRNSKNYQAFSSLYTTVYKCNKLIEALKDSPVGDEYKDQIEAEAKFIRAQAYFYIVRRWGNSPLHIDVPKTIGSTNLPRSPFWQIYGQVLSDLDYAEENMRTYEEQIQINSVGTGRVCRNAATAAKSIVYLTIGTLLAHSDADDNFWTCTNEEVFEGFTTYCQIPDAKTAFEKALACAEEVLPESSTTGSPYRLANQYADLFKWENPEDFHLSERIFCLISTNEMASNSTLAMWSLPRYYMDTANGNSFGRFRPSRFLFQKWCDTYGGVKGTSKNTKDIYVSSGDPRMDAAFIYSTYPGSGMWENPCYPGESSVFCYQNDYTRPLPYYKKYYDPKYNCTAGYADLYLIRLAEIYLVAAEACANLCESPSDTYGQKSIDYVNVILRRARNLGESQAAEPQDWTTASVEDKDDLILKIFWERCFELCGEQHEWYDTHRMGATWFGQNVTTPANAFLYEPEQEDFKDVADEAIPGHRTLFYGEPAFGDKKIYPELKADVRKGLLCAFPNDEIVYNTALSASDQNPSEIFWE